MKKLLLIDDDAKLGPPLATYLAQFELDLQHETDPLQGIERLHREHFDLVILDVMLPHIDGFETCRRIRRDSEIPIIMLTARGDVMDRVVGLELGADDYLPKPFEPRELIARVQNILKRSATANLQDGPLRFSRLQIHPATQQLLVDGREISLTANEFRLLLLLARDPRRVFSRDDIMLELNGIDADVYSRAIDIQISRLRQKLAPLKVISTVRGKGYQFVLAAAD